MTRSPALPGRPSPRLSSASELRDENTRLAAELATCREQLTAQQHEIEYLRAQLGASTDGILVMKDIFLDCNQTTCKIWKADRNDIIGCSPVDFAPDFQPNGERSCEMAKRKIRAALDGEPQCFFWKDMTMDGTLFDSQVSLRSVSVGGEEFVVATVRDVTEVKMKEDESRRLFEKLEMIQKRRNQELARFNRKLNNERTTRTLMEQALGAADHELDMVFETSSDGLVVVDAEQSIQRINKAYSELSGFNKYDIENKKCYQIFACKGCTGESCKVSKLLENSDRVEFHTECRTASGTVVPCILSATSLRDATGRVVGMVQNYRSNLPFKHWVEDLKYSEELYRAILSSISDAVIITDDDGAIFFLSHSVSTVFGYTLDELWKMENVKQLLGNFHSLETLRKEQEIRNIEFSIKDTQGQPHDLIVTIKQVNIRGATVLISCHDITEKKEAEREARLRNQQLEQASKMVSMGILVSGVAHEINNPNNFIMLNTQLLSRVWSDVCDRFDRQLEEHGDFTLANLSYAKNKDRISELYDGVLEGSQRIKRIVSDMKGYVRQDEGDIQQTVYLNSVIKHSLTLLNNQIKTATHDFSVDYSHSRPKVRGNFQKIEQIVVNLVQNSCDALPDSKRKLRISSKEDLASNTASIIVEDEGTGISKDHLEYIMDPFFTTKRSCGGTGLGLFISHRIMKELGGKLIFNSKPGKGTRVEAVLPLAEKRVKGETT